MDPWLEAMSSSLERLKTRRVEVLSSEWCEEVWRAMYVESIKDQTSCRGMVWSLEEGSASSGVILVILPTAQNDGVRCQKNSSSLIVRPLAEVGRGGPTEVSFSSFHPGPKCGCV
ncbi:hypothetical protein TNCV_4286441 [Trichonephila clavipes]|nr:hypothetical protein TNCV_4286441 [Trichonephila clavipes]